MAKLGDLMQDLNLSLKLNLVLKEEQEKVIEGICERKMLSRIYRLDMAKACAIHCPRAF